MHRDDRDAALEILLKTLPSAVTIVGVVVAMREASVDDD